MPRELSSRERIRLTLEHKETDRMPIDLGGSDVTTITIEPYERLKAVLGFQKPSKIYSRRFQSVFVDDEVQQRFHCDVRPIPYRASRKAKTNLSTESSFIDEWGVEYRRPEDGLYYDIVKYPLIKATIDDLKTYDWPDPDDPDRVEGVAEEARYWFENSQYALLGPGSSCSLFEQCWYLRGFEQFLIDLMINKEFAHALLRKVLDVRLQMYGRYLEQAGRYLDLVYVADDIAMQTGPIMSPATYREMIKPYQKEYFQFIKDKSQARLFYHCCGNVKPFLEDLIEIGVDVLNPVQVTATGMDPAELKQAYGDRLVFWGGIDTQRLLPKGAPAEVYQETSRIIDIMAQGGGYVLSAVHNIQADTPPENIVAMLNAAYEHGKPSSGA
jgi:uroporphyrinogen decarboxylase